jgi:hypothetical protein
MPSIFQNRSLFQRNLCRTRVSTTLHFCRHLDGIGEPDSGIFERTITIQKMLASDRESFGEIIVISVEHNRLFQQLHEVLTFEFFNDLNETWPCSGLGMPAPFDQSPI